MTSAITDTARYITSVLNLYRDPAYRGYRRRWIVYFDADGTVAAVLAAHTPPLPAGSYTWKFRTGARYTHRIIQNHLDAFPAVADEPDVAAAHPTTPPSMPAPSWLRAP